MLCKYCTFVDEDDPVTIQKVGSGVLFENKYLFSANEIVDASILCLSRLRSSMVGDGWNAINTGLVTYYIEFNSTNPTTNYH